MKKNILTSAAILALVFITAGCGTARKMEVNNVIYLIGDGMGLGAVSALILSEDSETGFEKDPVVGLCETSSANNYVTDSPAGGTALATGTRTNNGYVGVDPEGS